MFFLPILLIGSSSSENSLLAGFVLLPVAGNLDHGFSFH